jgi:gamma-glutamyl hercynylcysteine S-oxide synthase
MAENRSQTLALFQMIDPVIFCQQAHPDFSPVGWHLGHIGYVEAQWVLGQKAAADYEEYNRLFAADGLPKSERQNLPDLATTIAYLADVRSRVFDHLQTHDLDPRLWQFLLQHEAQHCETAMIVLALLGVIKPTFVQAPPVSGMITIPAGRFRMGLDGPIGLDNEQPAHWVELGAFQIDRAPVCWGDYREFMRSTGFDQRPYYASETTPDWHPVCGVSWDEADAYARFVGKRLPTEAEWERAAIGDDAIGNKSVGQVWEWTNSWFADYPGFRGFPYAGYSATYFDQAHRVLRGGSWATRRWAKRASFRNWYYPSTKPIFAGFRCACDYNT